MSGAFQTTRDIFENPIWKNIVEFRLFFLIYGNAIFSEEGYRVSDDLILQRGQWLRSTRKIQEDLTYIENRQVKTYSTSVINRCIKKLEREQRICTKSHELGTVFTMLNYEQYQGFMNYKKENLERNLEQYQNSVGTVEEQSGNNNKNVIKGNKEKDNVLYSQIINYLNEKAGTSFKSTTKSTKEHISGRVREGFTLEQFKTVIDKKCAEWKDNPNMSQYLRPQTLFGTKFESYLNQPIVLAGGMSSRTPKEYVPSAEELQRVERMYGNV
jgi:uncharacterized phage protein (TIGR02220 family)